MQYRTLGRTGVQVSTLVLGAMNVRGARWPRAGCRARFRLQRLSGRMILIG
jgi:aryl-alcohol dehydrogenase-like predicted oxidoreductase